MIDENGIEPTALANSGAVIPDKCSQCGEWLDVWWDYCPKCGKKIANKE